MRRRLERAGLVRRPVIDKRTALLVLALVAIFSIAIFMRMLPARYGFFLNEFDPYYNYRAVQFLVDSVDQSGLLGASEYFGWTDTQTWYPEGRPVSETSQIGLHFAGAMLYLIARDIFGALISVYDFLVLFPVFVGSLTTITIFLLVKKIAGPSAGLFAGLVLAVSPPIITRGNLGWFKSEPLALLTAIFASYVFLTVFDRRTSEKGLIWRSLVAGLLLGYANTAWGGSQFFSIVFGALLILVPFLSKNLKPFVKSSAILVTSILLVSASFPRPGPSFVSGPIGLLLVGGVGFTIVAYLVRRSTDPKKYHRTLLKILIAALLLGVIIPGFGVIVSPSERYQTVVNPFQRTANPLVESVAEHFVPTGDVFFASYAILIFLGGFGAIQALRRRSVPYIFAILFALAALYISSSFSRLLVFSTLSFAILAGIGLMELNSAIFGRSTASHGKKRERVYQTSGEVRVIYAISMVAFMSFPLGYPVNAGWISNADIPVTIATSSINIRSQVSDWSEALEWIRYNTPEDSVLASWWDYGYWITVMGDRTSLADNATINQTRIAQIGRMFMSDEAEATRILGELKADYVVIFVAGVKILDQSSGTILYRLGAGGDESKKQWFIRIGGLNEDDFIYDDEFTPKPKFWDETVLGKMMPFTFLQYVDLSQGRLIDNVEYQAGGRQVGIDAIYTYNEKYSRSEGEPFRLAFTSSSLREAPSATAAEPFAAVLIYEIVS